MFDRIVLINLNRRPDRLREFRQTQKDCGWPLPEPTIFEAFDGAKLTPPSTFLSNKGAWGCRCSHLAVVEQAIADKVQSLLILEDDVTWDADLGKKLVNFMAEVPPWDILMPGFLYTEPPKPVSKSVMRSNGARLTHAYAISGQALPAARLLLQAATYHIDWVLAGWHQFARVFCPTTQLFKQRGGPSDIAGGAPVRG